MSSLPIFCKEYFDLMDANEDEFCIEQWQLRSMVERAFQNERLIVDLELYEHYIGLGKYLGFGRGYEWERYCIGCYLCTFKEEDGLPRWDDGLFFMGRGAGKDGLISWMSLCLISPYNPIENYDVDICAFNEDQALRPVLDIHDALEKEPKKFKKFFKWTREKIRGIKNKGYIKGHTNNAKGKDGLRSGAVFLNEIHTYENYDNINVFTTGLGKKPHPRTGYFTTNGDVPDGPLDNMLDDAKDVLKNGHNDNGHFYFICRLNSKDEVHDELNWRKANPSLRYKPSLLVEMRKEYNKWLKAPQTLAAFMTKRMNIRQTKESMPVASWEDIKATNKELIDLKGWSCTCGIDFSKTNDWMAVDLHFKQDEIRYDINHAWICMQSTELWRLKCPYKEWANECYVTLVDEPEISPKLVSEYLSQMMNDYVIEGVAMDSYRFEILKDELNKLGFSYENKNIKLVRNSDIMKVVPIIVRCFLNHFFVWGEQPCLRWATNNSKLVPAKKSMMAADGELDMGNYLIGKIEPKARKTDPFMALVASMTIEDMLPQAIGSIPFDIGVLTF